YSTYAIPAVILAPDAIAGRIEVGVVVQAAGAFAAMLNGMTIFIDNFDSLSRFVAGIDRLETFRMALAQTPAKPVGGHMIRSIAANYLALKHLTLTTPDGE